MVSGSSSRSNDRSIESRADNWGTLEKPSPVGSCHGYQHFMRCWYSSASGGFGLVLSDRAVICTVKPLQKIWSSDAVC